MADLKNVLDSVSGWLKALVDFGLAVILVFVIIDILFPGTTGIIGNIETIVGAFSDKGVVGLIALLLFMLVYKK